jgi:methionyl-tRNA formyltransferase
MKSSIILDCVLIGSDSLLMQCGEVLTSKGHRILRVVTDAPRVRDWAEAAGIEVIDAATDYGDSLANTTFDYLFAITHLALIPDSVLRVPKRGAINFHDGPLPGYSGLNTPVWAIHNGEAEHGVTWHQMDAEIDKGDILIERTFPIEENDTALSLNTRCFEAGLDTFGELLDGLSDQSIVPVPQSGTNRRYYLRSDKPDGLAVLDWTQPAKRTSALIRALDHGRYANPLTSPKIVNGSQAVIAIQAETVEISDGGAPGQLIEADAQTFVVCTQEGGLRVTEVTDLSGRALDATAAMKLLNARVGDQLTVLTPDQRGALSDQGKGISRAEAHWVNALRNAEGTDLPWSRLSETPEHGFERIELQWEQDVAAEPTAHIAASRIAALGLAIAKLTGKRDLTIGLGFPGESPIAGPGEGLFSDRTLLEFKLEGGQTLAELVAAVAGNIDRAVKRGPWARDVFARTPELRERSTPFSDGGVNIHVEITDAIEAFEPRSSDQLALRSAHPTAGLTCSRKPAASTQTLQPASPAPSLGWKGLLHRHRMHASPTFPSRLMPRESACSGSGMTPGLRSTRASVSTTSSPSALPRHRPKLPSYSTTRRSPTASSTNAPVRSQRTWRIAARGLGFSSAFTSNAPSISPSASSQFSTPERPTSPWTQPSQ